MDDRCFACGRKFRVNSYGLIPFHPWVLTEDGAQRIPVGHDCFRRIAEAGAEGYQPKLGGPRLFTETDAPAEALRAAGITVTRL